MAADNYPNRRVSFLADEQQLVLRFRYVTNDIKPEDTRRRLRNYERLIVFPFSFLSKHETRLHTHDLRTRITVTRGRERPLGIPVEFSNAFSDTVAMEFASIVIFLRAYARGKPKKSPSFYPENIPILICPTDSKLEKIQKKLSSIHRLPLPFR